MGESEFVRHIACPNCGSSDANAVFTDDHTFCFSCLNRGSIMSETKKSFSFEGDCMRLDKRRISEDTCRKFNVRVSDGHLKFPYTITSGQITGYKERERGKEFRWQGKNPEKRLFGQQLFGPNKSIVVTEGELDCLSVWESRPKWPVVSISSGAAGAYKNLQAQLNYLLQFDEIILLFDNDSAGQDAALQCAGLFPPERCLIGNMGAYNDPSEALQAGDPDAIRQAVWNASPYTPKTIVEGTTIYELLRRPMVGKDADWPFEGLNTMTGGLRLGELVVLTAPTGGGKSTLCTEVAYSLLEQGFKVGYISLEESVRRAGLRLMSCAANKPLHTDNSTIDEETFKAAFDKSVGCGRLYLRDGFGSVDPSVIINDLRFLAKSGVQWLILDHLSILLSGNATNNERAMIDETMTNLRCFVEETGVGLILISHLRRTNGDKGFEDGNQEITLSHLRGSHSVAQLADVVAFLARNITAGENRAQLAVIKNRFNGCTGKCGYIMYDKETGRMLSTDSPSTHGEDKNPDF